MAPPLDAGRFSGLLYRALNPVYARKPLSGRGAALFGGRFNRKGRETLYTALRPETALREANQVGTLQPTTLVAYRADLGPIVDGRDDTVLAPYGMDGTALAAPDWRDRMISGLNVPTHDLTERLVADGFVGLFVPSYAKGSDATDLNLVLWRWNSGADDRLLVVDDEDRLR